MDFQAYNQQYEDGDENNNSLNNIDDNSDSEERIPLVCTKNIAFNYRQPSFISLTGQVVTKAGEQLGNLSQQHSLSTLDLINIHYNEGKFTNPIIVVENDDSIDNEAYPEQRQFEKREDNFQQKSLSDFNEVQKFTAQRLCKRNEEFWHQIGYFPGRS